jgi:hypothetical protein
MNTHVAHTSQNHDRRINEALRRLGSATPPPGIEDRIKARLAQAQNAHSAAAHGSRFFVIPRFAFGAATVAIACAAIVAGSVSHSHKIQPVLPGFVSQPSSGAVGSAGAARPANHPIEPSPAGRPRSVRRLPAGRAVISSQSQKPAGVAVPKSPSPAQ